MAVYVDGFIVLLAKKNIAAYKKIARKAGKVNAKAMADPRTVKMSEGGMPFDEKRLLWGGFETLVRM